MRTARFILTIVLFSAMAMSAATAADWLRYGGPTADFKLSVKGLASSWPKTGPTELWSRELGGGYAGILVKGDRLYTMFRRGDDEVVTALDTSTGRTLWEHSYEAKPDPSQNLQFGSGPKHLTADRGRQDLHGRLPGTRCAPSTSPAASCCGRRA